MTDDGWLTLTEAGELVGLSARTLKRRIDDGELPGTKRPWRGQQEAWQVRAEDLVAWAEGTGQTLTMPDNNTGHATTGAEGLSETEPAHDPDTARAEAAEVDRLRRELSATHDRLAEVERERDWLRNHAEQLTRALPAPRQEPTEEAIEGRDRGRTWWDRLLGK